MANGFRNAFITLAPDCPVAAGHVPVRPTSIAGLEHSLLIGDPYHYTAEELFLAVQRRHKNVSDAELGAFKAFLASKPRPCMRLSMLPKRWGWGIHFDARGRMAIFGTETQEYENFSTRTDERVMPAWPSRRMPP